MIGLASCVPNCPPPIELSPKTVVPDKLGILLWADGVGADTLAEYDRQGLLPNIHKYLIARGVSVRSACASLPTITYANNASFNTGLLPGHHQLTGNAWFDRNVLIYQNYSYVKSYLQADDDLAAPTIHEMLAGQATAAILTPIHRGATFTFENFTSAGVAWIMGDLDTVDHLTTLRFTEIATAANADGRWPVFILAYYSSPDVVYHHHNGTKTYHEIVLDLDDQVGHLCQSLEKAGLLEKTYLMFVSDHGVVPTENHVPLGEYFRKTLGVPAVTDDYGEFHSYDDRLAHFAPARVVVVAGGDRHCAIHLRAGDHWWQRPTEEEIDGFAAKFGAPASPEAKGATPTTAPTTTAPAQTLPDMLAALPATDLVFVHLSSDSLRVQTAAGMGVLERTRADGKKLYRYRVTRGADPLGYAGHPATATLMDGAFHPGDAWFQASLGSPRPDVLVQMLELNDSPRAGDIIVFARPGWDFGRHNFGGHGGLTREEIFVPWLIAGPGLPPGATLDGARTVDILPTMLDLLDHHSAIPDHLDGVSQAARLRQAGK
jgi:arylsulfatase A-like enzyme